MATSGNMDDHPSPALIEAQAQLDKLRRQHAARKAVSDARPAPAPDHDGDLARGGLTTAVPDGAEPKPAGDLGTRHSPSPTGSPFSNNDVSNSYSELPPWWDEAVATVAAGRQWGSASLTAAIRRALATREGADASGPDWQIRPVSETLGQLGEKEKTAGDIGHEEPHSVSTDGGAKNYTTLGVAVKQAKEAKFYRVWLLARLLDTAGSGWVAIDELREALCSSGSSLRISKPTTNDTNAWSNLRALLRAGEGRYWTRETGRNGVERLRYVTPVDLAHRLGVQRLVGAPVLIPVEVLTNPSIADFRAYLVKSYHASRQGEDDRTAPISRGTLVQMTGVSERTLRRYDKRADVTAIPNYEIGEVATTAAMQEAAWEHGTAIFEFIDYKGHEGRPGRKYIARVLPNAYSAEMQTAPRGRQRKINKQLRDACDNGAQANGEAYRKIYHDRPVDAVTAFNRDPDAPIYYRDGQLRNGAGLWRKFG